VLSVSESELPDSQSVCVQLLLLLNGSKQQGGNVIPLSVQQEQQTSVALISATASTEIRFDADMHVQILQHDRTLRYTQLYMGPAGITLHVSTACMHTYTHTTEQTG